MPLFNCSRPRSIPRTSRFNDLGRLQRDRSPSHDAYPPDRYSRSLSRGDSLDDDTSRGRNNRSPSCTNSLGGKNSDFDFQDNYWDNVGFPGSGKCDHPGRHRPPPSSPDTYAHSYDTSSRRATSPHAYIHPYDTSSRRITPPDPQTIVTTWGEQPARDLVTHSRFYTRIEIPEHPMAPDLEIPVDPIRHCRSHERTAVVLHAVHPVPKRYLRRLVHDSCCLNRLRYVGEWLDEEMFVMMEASETLEIVQETLRHINEVLTQAGESGIDRLTTHRARRSEEVKK